MDLIERLRALAGSGMGDISKTAREAAAALEAAREDAADAEKWNILSMRRENWPELDFAMEDAERFIDQTRGRGDAERGWRE